MSRYPRNFLKTSYFHVITQGINKSYIFDKAEDMKFYIKNMYQLVKEHHIRIIAYCIMNNHAHILIEAQSVNELSKYMQRLNTRYGKYYNKKYQRVGYVFRDRYKSEGIYGEKHLYSCIKYIYDNPVKAGICQRAKEYPYSNFREINKDLDDNYVFIDIDDNKETAHQDIINKFLIENNIKQIDLKDNNNKIKELIILLKEKHHISLRKIAKELGLNREVIRRIYNK